ncbi:hypothetical protein VTH06DRAFT_2644 [Thermothelomyces fergusii]
MPPRTFVLDLSRRSSYVCKSCLDSLRTTSARPWLSRTSSTAARGLQPSPRNSKRNGDGPDSAQFQRLLIEEFERGPEPASSSGGLDVAYFDQEAPGKLRRLRDNEEFGEVSGGLDSAIETAIDDLEKKMITTAKMLQSMEDQGQLEKADRLRKQFKRTLRWQYKGWVGPEAEEYEQLRIRGFSGRHHRAVSRLNQFFERKSVIKGGVTRPEDVAQCWKIYSSVRRTLALAWHNVPREVWNFLWTILSWEGDGGIKNPNRMHHIYILAKDMQAAGVPLRDSQRILAIEAMFIEGWKAEAIEEWKKAAVTLGSRPETFTDYWELGVRMCSLHGDTDRALRAAETLLRSPQSPNARILLPVIRAMAAKRETVDQAWETYTHMRTLLGETMTIEDYDEVIAVFLASDDVEYALQAFVDMMFSRTIDVRGKTKLPLPVGNQFFVGKWLKRLIGMGDLEGAYKVVAFVQGKGVTPYPVQLNGLIGAWLRSGTAENLEKAERLAWSMIRARLDYVQWRRWWWRQRQDPVGPDRSGPMPATAGAEGASEFVCRTRATAETFSLLAENYCSRRLHDRLRELFEVLDQAEIGRNSFLMNQLLRSHSQNGEADKAVLLYESLTKEQNVRPDGHTFLTLFNTLSVNRLVQRDPELTKQDIASARRFFRDMVAAKWKFDSPEIFAQLPRTILFSMLKMKDYRGMLIAARAMRELFAFHPTEALLIEMASGAGSLEVNSRRNMQRLVSGRKTIEALMRKHRLELIKAGHPGVEMTEEEKLNELHDVLEKLILLKAGAHNASKEEVEPLLDETAQEMGVYDIVVTKDANVIATHRKLGKNSVPPV